VAVAWYAAFTLVFVGSHSGLPSDRQRGPSERETPVHIALGAGVYFLVLRFSYQARFGELRNSFSMGTLIPPAECRTPYNL